MYNGDHWVAVQTPGGVRDYMQIGDDSAHFPGKRFNRHYGFPKFGNAKTEPGDSKWANNRYYCFVKTTNPPKIELATLLENTPQGMSVTYQNALDKAKFMGGRLPTAVELYATMMEKYNYRKYKPYHQWIAFQNEDGEQDWMQCSHDAKINYFGKTWKIHNGGELPEWANRNVMWGMERFHR